MSTIFAVSSGNPPAAIAVLRISGPAAVTTAQRLCGALPPPRQAALRAVRDPETGALLDRALLLWFAAPRSATGEDLVELHLHGGRAVVTAVQRVLAAQPGLRGAEPGEFTRRALESGRIDLAEAEGLGDLLLAQTEAQRRRALAATEGVVSRAVAAWSDQLLALSAMIESELDFSDEADVGTAAGTCVANDIAALAQEIDAVIAAPPVERLRDGLRVVLAGPPNSGKSTLLNAMAMRDAAITSPIAGTTRDAIEVPIVRDGIAYVLTDTAGLAAETADPIEAMGIARASELMALADIVLWLGDEEPPVDVTAVWLYPRADIRSARPAGRLPVSAISLLGIDALWGRLAETAAQLLPRDDQLAVNARQREWLAAACGELRLGAAQRDLLLIAEHLRVARGFLDRITGATHVEDVLDALFGRFCIGK